LNPTANSSESYMFYGYSFCVVCADWGKKEKTREFRGIQIYSLYGGILEYK